MKKFQFRLQKLLDVRTAAERLIQNELAVVVGEQNALKSKQQEFLEKLNKEKSKLHENIKDNALSVDDMLAFQKFSKFTDVLVAGTERDIEKLQPKVNEIRGRLVEAVREKKIVEKLKERKLEKWEYEYNKMMEKEADEINQKSYSKRIRENFEIYT